jgi:hypothetical protein
MGGLTPEATVELTLRAVAAIAAARIYTAALVDITKPRTETPHR